MSSTVVLEAMDDLDFVPVVGVLLPATVTPCEGPVTSSGAPVLPSRREALWAVGLVEFCIPFAVMDSLTPAINPVKCTS